MVLAFALLPSAKPRNPRFACNTRFVVLTTLSREQGSDVGAYRLELLNSLIARELAVQLPCLHSDSKAATLDHGPIRHCAASHEKRNSTLSLPVKPISALEPFSIV
jgi:hypothetical protein